MKHDPIDFEDLVKFHACQIPLILHGEILDLVLNLSLEHYSHTM